MMAGTLFADYYADWVNIFKEGGPVRPATVDAYRQAVSNLKMLAPDLPLSELNKREYQHIINRYSKGHARNSVRQFHSLLKPAILDALDDGLIATNPTRRTVIKGKAKTDGRNWLHQEEAARLCQEFELEKPVIREAPRRHSRGQELEVNWDWLFLLCLKTGIRFSEALALTPGDFDFEGGMLDISKTFDYKYSFRPLDETKSGTSARAVQMDGRLCDQFRQMVRGKEPGMQIFVPPGQRVHNSTANKRLKVLCFQADIPEISIHGLRHTHASLLLYSGVSINTVSKRLGHSRISLTLDCYSHIIKELEEMDSCRIADIMASVYDF